jgi:hypothetical protein
MEEIQKRLSYFSTGHKNAQFTAKPGEILPFSGKDRQTNHKPVRNARDFEGSGPRHNGFGTLTANPRKLIRMKDEVEAARFITSAGSTGRSEVLRLTDVVC